MAPWSTTRIALVLASTFGLIWAHAIGVTGFFDPTNIDWMFEGDWQAQLYGWLFARIAPWGIPFSQAPNLVYPFGSSAALTDSVPSLILVSKLASPLFGERMQPFGVWMVTGIMATGAAGVLICRAWLRDLPSLTFAGCLFVMNPVLTTRYGHIPFFGFWAIFALVGLCIWPVNELKSARRIAAVTIACGFFACSTTAYVAMMCMLLVGAGILRLVLVARAFKPREALAWLFAAPAFCLLSLYLFGWVKGALNSPKLTEEGFGQFSADLLTFFNPSIWSRFISGFSMGPRQYEGFAYLGLGVIALVLVRLVLLVRFRPSRSELLTWVPLLIAIVLMGTFALSNIVTVAGKPVANWSAFYSHLGQYPQVFRSSGRFIWPMFCTLYLVAALAVTRIEALWVRQWVLGLGVLLQFVDINPTQAPIRHPYPHFEPSRDPAWALLNEYQHLVISPIQLQWVCPYDHILVSTLSWQAYRQNLTINSGHVGRAPPGSDCKKHLSPAELDDQTVYIPYFAEYVPDLVNAGFVCGQVERWLVCVSPNRDTALQRLLRTRAAPR
ncbi:MAG: DUF6311 domain-containing protein [Archangium sp.]